MLPFDQQRKFMSILVKNEHGEYIMFSKGADQEMLKRIAASSAQRAKIKEKTDRFATMSMRTMMFAMRRLDSSLVEQFMEFERERENLQIKEKDRMWP